VITLKNEDEMVAAFRLLWKNAENDFERHRIESLVRDLVEPPKPEQVDENHQRFNGKNYTKSKSGHYRASFQLHRDIFEYYKGDIPEGNFQIHHKDFNPDNNNIENLQLMTIEEHHRLHMKIDRCRLKKKIFVCEQCGKTFKVYKHWVKTCCSKKCRQKLTAEEYSEWRECKWCGKKFKTLKSSKKQYCSHTCCNRATAPRRGRKKVKSPATNPQTNSA